MREGLAVLQESLRDTYDNLLFLVPANLVTILLLLPVVTAPPALAGLWAVGNRVARGEKSGWRVYFAAFRACFGRAWAVAGLHLLALATLLADLWFYAPANNPLGLPPTISFFIQAFFLGMYLFWLLLSQYFLPLLMEQDDRRIRTMVRNAAVLLTMQPGPAVLLLAVTLLTSLASTLLAAPWLLLTPAFLAVLTNNAVVRLTRAGQR